MNSVSRLKRAVHGAVACVLALVAVSAAGAQSPVMEGSKPSGVAAAPRPAPTDAAVAAFFDDYMATTIKNLEIPGAAIVVVRDGRPVLAKAYGYADLASRRPFDINRDVAQTASVSKLLPWVLTMQLVEEGRLDLDRDVNAYLDFRIPAKFGRPITLRHLMTHSAGFADRFNGVLFPVDLKTPLGVKLRRSIPLRVYPAGTTVAYSNYGAALAGYIVQRVREESWEEAVSRRIFTPAGMSRSSVAQPLPETLRPWLANHYSHGSTTPTGFRAIPLAPMGSLTASPADMGRFVAMLQNGGQGVRGRVLQPASLKRMFSLQKPLGPGLKSGMGLGFFVGEHRGIRYAGHGGNMTTLATDLEVLPDHGIAFYYVLTGQGPANAAGRTVRGHLLRSAIDKLLLPPLEPIRARGPSSATEVAGSYTNTRRQRSGMMLMGAMMDTAEAFADEDGSLIIYLSGHGTRWLPAGRDRFAEESSGEPLAITRGPDGRVERIASPLLFPVGEFERAPAYIPWVELITKFSLVTIALAVIAAPIISAIRRRRLRNRPSEPAPASKAPPSKLSTTTRPLARKAFWIIVAMLAGWGIFAALAASDPSIIFTTPAPIRYLMAAISSLTAPLAALMLFDAIIGFRDSTRGWASRLGRLLVASACVGLAWLIYVFDVISSSNQW